MFLKDSGPSFQKYIEDGLSQIEREKNMHDGGDPRSYNDGGSARLENNRTLLQDSNVGGIKTPEYHMARLQALIVCFKNIFLNLYE